MADAGSDVRGEPRRGGASAWRPYAVLPLLACALPRRAWLAPPMLHDSFWIDVVWADQFTDGLRHGLLYPRWLPSSHGGLGSPVFYFYAPGAFWLTGLFGIGGASAYGAVLLAFAAAMLASGAAMYRWLAGWTARPLAGACFYVAAPYHLCDFYGRGALAEACAFAIVPLLAAAMRRAGERRGFAALAVAYAALAMTHLPIALLASILLVAPYGLVLIHIDRRAAAPIAFGVLLGAALAAVYLVPALALQPYAAIDKLWRVANLLPAHASFVRPDLWPPGARMTFMVLTTATLAATAAFFVWGGSEFWGWYALGCCAVVAGLVPGFWSLPLLIKVQFPWRALLLVEFGLATALARSRAAPLLAALVTIPALMLSTVFLQPGPGEGQAALASLLARHPDVLEYLPRGASDEMEVPSRRALALAAYPPPRHSGGRTIEPIFYFPAWTVRCGGAVAPTFPDPATRLLSYRGRDCTVRLGWTAAERIGGAISLAALLSLLAIVIRRRRRSAGAAARDAGSPRR